MASYLSFLYICKFPLCVSYLCRFGHILLQLLFVERHKYLYNSLGMEKNMDWRVLTMKIFGIAVLMIGALIALSLGLDILRGFDARTALYNAFSIFRVMELTELFVAFLFVFLFAIESIVFLYKKKKQAKKDEKQPQS